MSVAEFLILLAALAALSGGPVRLPRSWLWLPCAFPLALVAGGLLSPRDVLGPDLEALDLLVLLVLVVVCWLVTDARPALALCLAVLLETVTGALSNLIFGDYLNVWLDLLLIQFAFVLPVLLPVAWLLLRRQKAPSPHPFP